MFLSTAPSTGEFPVSRFLGLEHLLKVAKIRIEGLAWQVQDVHFIDPLKRRTADLRSPFSGLMFWRKAVETSVPRQGEMNDEEAFVVTPGALLKQSRYGMLFVIATSFFLNILVLVSPLYMQQVFDRVVQTQHLETLIFLTLMAVSALVFLGAIDTLRNVGLSRIGRWTDESLRTSVFGAALQQARTEGRINGQVVSDLTALRNFVGSPQVVPFFDAVWMPLFLALMFALHPAFGAIGLISAAILFLLAFWNDLGTRRRMAGISAAQVRVGAFSNTLLRNADVVHGMGMFGAAMDRYGNETRRIADHTQRATDFGAIVGGISKFTRILVQVLVLGIGAYLVTKGEVTSGAMLASSIILGRALAPVEQSISAWRAFVAAREAYGRINEAVAKTAHRAMPAIRLPDPVGRIQIENVSFRFPKSERLVLRNINLDVPAGSIVALVGPSGSGKSTLCKILVGSWLPTAGGVRLDGASVQNIARDQIGDWVGYLPQGIELFNGSVRDNISRMKTVADQEIVAAAQLAGCHQLILRLPDGYATDLGEGGNNLSGGQKQRIALARTVFGNPKFVVLDEPNSNLDAEGESALVATIVALKQRGVTVVLVSHRLSVLSPVDFIAVLREGAVDMFGEREAVMQELARRAREGGSSGSPAPGRTTEATGH